MELIRKNVAFIIFTFLSVAFSLAYVSFVFLHGGLAYVESRGALREIGKGLGSLGFFALALVYARSFLKLLLVEESFWKRLEPLGKDFFDPKKFSLKILVFLNKTHAYLGVLAIILIFMHCYLTGSYQDNLLLQIVLGLMALEGLTGFVLKFKYTPAQLRKKSYLIHRKFIIGMMLLVFAVFGHLLLGD